MLALTPAKSRWVSGEVLWIGLVIVAAYGIVPLAGTDYLLDAVLTPFLALSLAAVGLNVLTGYAGQVSLGSAAFLAVGAYAAYNLHLRIPTLPLLIDLVLAGGVAAVIGIIFGLPSLRLRGFYLAVSTLAAQFFVQWALTKFSWFSNDNPSGVIDAPILSIGSITFTSPAERYVFSLTIVVVLTLLTLRLLRSQSGRNFIAVRDHEIAAKVIGVPLLRTKLLAFALSSFIIGVAGVLWAFAYLRTVEPAGFNLDRSFQILFIIIIGGLASLRGSFIGAAFIVVFPLLLSRIGAALLGNVFDSGVLEMSQRIVIGALIIAFLIAEPRGLIALWDRARHPDRQAPRDPDLRVAYPKGACNEHVQTFESDYGSGARRRPR
ncbi:branched-chain amino acid ABC transporter permease [Bradyrhizobium sp. CCBAU 11386]|uniref:branched-chain amino acid ABC transporter permease n=1 Tax=Bradyrhizobium sp. CCBAU 11386 TaxID=1630837 RepID=UPI00230498CE|nr:branched-chain amino acid ABC transporter permease [Bradyrhizobium sp. CCBAU 11386]